MDLLLFLSKTVFRMAWTKDCGRGRVFSIRLWGIVPIHLSGLLCNNLLLKELLGLLAAKEFLNQVVVKALIKNSIGMLLELQQGHISLSPKSLEGLNHSFFW